MKIVTKLFLSLCLVAGLGATLTANAQIRSDVTIRATIPYSFVVNNTTLPAGTYVITVLDPDGSDASVLKIRSADGRTVVLFDTDSVTVPGLAPQSELVFDKVGDTYFLSKVFRKGDEGGNELPKSKRQRSLEENESSVVSHSIAASTEPAKFSKPAARKVNRTSR